MKIRFQTLVAVLLTLFVFAATGCKENKTVADPNTIISNNDNMPVYVIERDIPGAGKLSKKDLQEISEKSCGVLKQMGSGIKWMHSYVTDDKIYCVYSASDTSALIAHAKNGGFPINKINGVHNMISPVSAESK